MPEIMAFTLIAAEEERILTAYHNELFLSHGEGIEIDWLLLFCFVFL